MRPIPIEPFDERGVAYTSSNSPPPRVDGHRGRCHLSGRPDGGRFLQGVGAKFSGAPEDAAVGFIGTGGKMSVEFQRCRPVRFLSTPAERTEVGPFALLFSAFKEAHGAGGGGPFGCPFTTACRIRSSVMCWSPRCSSLESSADFFTAPSGRLKSIRRRSFQFLRSRSARCCCSILCISRLERPGRWDYADFFEPIFRMRSVATSS